MNTNLIINLSTLPVIALLWLLCWIGMRDKDHREGVGK